MVAQLDEPIMTTNPISGGDIHAAYQITTPTRALFVKVPQHAHGADLLAAEAGGLALLRGKSPLLVPELIAQSAAPPYLVLNYLKPAPPDRSAWEKLGRGLAALHRNTAPTFGLDHANFIGTLSQRNPMHTRWADFYAEARLLPQLQWAVDRKHLNTEDTAATERLCHRLPELLPEEPPALIHGDFWSGNFHCATGGRMYLIDPAVCYAHREMDLALARLFGGFDAAFYAAYQAAYPLLSGWEERLPIYQLYYLLAHVNMFGAAYVGRTRRILREF